MSELMRTPAEPDEDFENDGQLMEDLADLGKLKSDYEAACERMRRANAFIAYAQNGLPPNKKIITYTDTMATEILTRDETGKFMGQSTLYGTAGLLPFLGDGIQFREGSVDQLIVTNSELGIAVPVGTIASIVDDSTRFTESGIDSDPTDKDVEYETDAFERFEEYSTKLRAKLLLGEKSIFADSL